MNLESHGSRSRSSWRSNSLNKYQVIFRPEATEEVVEAWHWYRAKGPEVAENFNRQLAAVIDKISVNPMNSLPFIDETRIAMVRRYPYQIVFEVIDHRVEVLAVKHSARRPGYWRSRKRR
ncbi:type II toxin-antitoxin system RelE/ParE family toxin [Lacunimicrobium album]